MVRQFLLHQKVGLAADNSMSSKHLSPDGIYEITRLLPEDQGGMFHYRIRSSAGELVVKESLLVATTTPPDATQRHGGSKSVFDSIGASSTKQRAKHLISLVRALGGGSRLPVSGKPRWQLSRRVTGGATSMAPLSVSSFAEAL